MFNTKIVKLCYKYESKYNSYMYPICSNIYNRVYSVLDSSIHNIVDYNIDSIVDCRLQNMVLIQYMYEIWAEYSKNGTIYGY